MKSLGVHIKVKDFRKSEKFYSSLGFEKVFEYGPGKKVEEDYSGAVFNTGDGTIEIADGHRAVKPEIFKQEVLSSKISLVIQVLNLESIIKKCHRANIFIAVKPRHYYWGTLELVIKDPDGVVLVFACPYSKHEAKRIAASEEFGQKPN